MNVCPKQNAYVQHENNKTFLKISYFITPSALHPVYATRMRKYKRGDDTFIFRHLRGCKQNFELCTVRTSALIVAVNINVFCC